MLPLKGGPQPSKGQEIALVLYFAISTPPVAPERVSKATEITGLIFTYLGAS